MPRILDRYGNIVSYFHHDEGDNTITVGQTQDCESIIENNKRLQTMNDGYSPSRELRRVASIPFVVFERWLQDDGLTWYDYSTKMDRREQAAYRARKLLSSDWAHLLTSAGSAYVGWAPKLQSWRRAKAKIARGVDPGWSKEKGQ